jgi:hypothetical protein
MTARVCVTAMPSPTIRTIGSSAKRRALAAPDRATASA